MKMRNFKICTVCMISLVFVDNLRAERKYTFGTQIDFVGGYSNRAPVSGLNFARLEAGFLPFYGIHPSLELKSLGRHSTFELGYAFGLNRTENELNVDSETHAAKMAFSAAIGPKWGLKLSESFLVTPDFTTFNVLRGVEVTPEEVAFVFDPVAIRRSSYINKAAFELDYAFDTRSNLSVSLSHAWRQYESNPNFEGRLSNQQKFGGALTYARKIDPHRGWTIRYSVFQLQFRDFHHARSQSVVLGYSQDFSPTLTIRLTAGPSYTEELGSSRHYLGYDASVALLKSVRSKHFKLYYSRHNGDTTGLGSISDVQRVGLGIALPVWRRVSMSLNASGFEGKRRLDNPLGIRGLEGSLLIGLVLSQNWSFNLGGAYQRHVGSELLDVEMRRAFVSLRFKAPEFWRFAR